MFLGELPRVWVAIVAGALIAVELSGRTALTAQFFTAIVSMGVGYVSFEDAAVWAGRSEWFAALVMTALGYHVIKLVTGLMGDREFLKSIIMAKMGGSK